MNQSRTLLYSPDRTRRMVRRMAYEIVEKNKGAENLVIFGILNRGAVFAEALLEALAPVADTTIPVFDLDVTSFRDDVDRDDENVSPSQASETNLTGKDVLLVDDVLYTGRTVRAALDAIVAHGRPNSIQLAVLIDRGHREYPVKPTFVGHEVPTKYREHIEVVFDDGITVFVDE